jgi:hypothetical protein
MINLYNAVLVKSTRLWIYKKNGVSKQDDEFFALIKAHPLLRENCT